MKASSKNWPSKPRIFSLFFFGGFFAGTLSLIVAVFFYPIFALQTRASIFVFVALEELIKIFLLWFIFRFLKPETKPFLVGSLIFGLGFGALEAFLIYLNDSQITFQFFGPLLVHIATSFLIALGFSFGNRKKSVLVTSLFFLAAIGLHYWYNINIAGI